MIGGYDGKGHYTDVTTECTFNPPEGTQFNEFGIEKITVSYKEFQTEFDIEVSAKPVSWSAGSNEEIEELFKANEAGVIDLTKIWPVGEERQVQFSAMPKGVTGEAHAAQSVTLVLANEGGYMAADGSGECAFIFMMKQCLNELGNMCTQGNTGGWHDSERREWCQTTAKSALPAYLQDTLVTVKTKTSGGPGKPAVEDSDILFLPAEKEIMGKTVYAVPGTEDDLEQWTYFAIESNRQKTADDVKATWWGRSSHKSFSNFTATSNEGIAGSADAKEHHGVSFAGCIGRKLS